MDDSARFTELFTRFHGRVLSYATRRVGPDAAQDIVGEVFSSAWLHLDRVPEDALPPYGIPPPSWSRLQQLHMPWDT